MVTNNLQRLFCRSSRYIFLTALLLMALTPSLQSQVSGYFLDQSRADPRFIQRLAWAGDEYTLRYEVLVERNEATGFRHFLREFTTNRYIEVSLSPGNYRFRVIPYDYLDRPGNGTGWMPFEVHAAFNPELDDNPPVFFYSDRDAAYLLIISGRNMVLGAEMYLRGRNGVEIYPKEIRIYNDGKNAQLLFDRNRLISGDYEVIVRNPGGLQASKAGIIVEYTRPEAVPEVVQVVVPEKPMEISVTESPIEDTAAEPEPEVTREPVEPIEKKKLIDVHLSAAWMPLFNIYGEQNQFSGSAPSPGGAGIRFGALYSGSSFLNIGLELAGSWYVFNADENPGQHVITGGLNVLARKFLPHSRMAITVRLGAGLSFLPGNQDSPPLDQSFRTDMGVSFLVFAQKHLFLEAGLEYVHFFSAEPSGCIRPWFGIGWQF